MSEPLDRAALLKNRRDLFLTGFLVLFLELACIRWFAAQVTFLQFFTNLILIASFLGMSVGCAAAGARTDWLRRFPWLALIAFGLALGLRVLYDVWGGLAIDVGGQRESPQMVFFGTEYKDLDLASFVVPLEVVAAVFFVLIALLFVGPGQALGRAFNRDPGRVGAYTANILGSLAGIAAFSLVSLTGLPAVVWFIAAFLVAVHLMRASGSIRTRDIALLSAAVLLVTASEIPRPGSENHWSPYYRIQYAPEKHSIVVNNVGHQTMVAYDADPGAPVYSLPHLLRRDSGGEPFRDVLVIGAGSGNDLAHALRHGADRIDAVEIDPVIQRLGKRDHPDRPYDDSKVTVHLDDGRNFLRRTEKKYDLVVYALVDSLILHSSLSNIRLESFLFTKQAFADVARVLKPGGVFVTYNYFRQGWIVQRVSSMLERVFGKTPLVVALPHSAEIRADDPEQIDRITMVMVGGTDGIADAFARGDYGLAQSLSPHEGTNGFDTGADPGRKRIAPAKLVEDGEPLAPATDDWPFLYLRSPMVPTIYLRGAALLIAIGLVLVFLLSPGRRLPADGRMFFLGAAFLLLETKAVVHLSLVFGSTWTVNSMVFAAILVMVVLANLYVLAVGRVRLQFHYAALFAALLANAAIPLDRFLAGGVLVRYVAPCALVMVPLFFAGVIFAVSFKRSREPDRAFGANVAGAVVGGFAEYLSMLLGFRYLLLVAAGLYALSAVFRKRR